MIDIFLFLLLTAIAIFLIALPYLRRPTETTREAFDLAVYQDQLAELDRDLDRGVIDAEAARAARLEVQRRIIALDDQGEPAQALARQGRFSSVVTAILVIIVPLASAFVYFQTGRPHMRDVPLATRILPEQQNTGQQSVLADIQQLQQRLEETPEDSALWTTLARTQLSASLFGDAAGSFNKALEYGGENPMLRAELGETMVSGAEGLVTPGAFEEFRKVLEIAPNEPRSRYYIGLASAQEGNVDAAVANWSQLLEASPSDAPWRPQIVQSIRGVLESNGRSADEIVANLPEGSASSGGGAEAASGHPQDEQIRAMVDGLAARLENDPENVEGWMMLGRSRLVLGELGQAKTAFERALDLAPENPDVLIGYAATLLEPSAIPGSDPIVGEEAIAIYEKLVTLTPDDPEPRWLLGLAAAQNGDRESAIGHWRDLLGLIEEGNEDREIVEARIAALESGEPAAALAAGAPSLAPPTTATNSEPSEAQPGSGLGPTEEDRAAMAALSPEERSGQIRSMVEGLAARLEEDPSDVEGWLRLAQSRNVLGEHEAAKEAYRRALEQAPDNTDVLRAYAANLLGAPHPETNAAAVTEDAADLYRRIIGLEPDDPEAHWYLGLAAVQDGSIADAKTHWQRVLDILGPNHPNYAAVQSSLEEVETKTQ